MRGLLPSRIRPNWFARPALSRISASSPTVPHIFDDYNTGQPYDERVKPFNFLFAAYIAPFGHPARACRPLIGR